MSTNHLVAVATIAAPIELLLGCFCVNHGMLLLRSKLCDGDCVPIILSTAIKCLLAYAQRHLAAKALLLVENERSFAAAHHEKKIEEYAGWEYCIAYRSTLTDLAIYQRHPIALLAAL
jgi:hypothetical protein